MSEKLTGMVEKNIFTRIAVSAVNLKTQDAEGMQELAALYLAMKWISAEEAGELLGYAQSKLVATEPTS
ncbi:MAG: hypothetical protein AB9856_03415 [Cellulosilyticaceae bacterium]